MILKIQQAELYLTTAHAFMKQAAKHLHPPAIKWFFDEGFIAYLEL